MSQDNPYLSLVPNSAEGEANPYADLLRKDDEQRQAQLDVVLSNATQANPDQAAEAQRLARERDMPVALVERNLAEVRRRERLNELRTATAFSPVLRTQLENPDFARMAHDDVENLSRLEIALQGTGNFFGGIGELFNQTYQGMQQQNSDEIAGMLTDTRPAWAQRMFPYTPTEQDRALAAAGARQRDQALAAFQSSQTRGDALMPQNFDEWPWYGRWAYSGGQSVAVNAPTMALGILTRSPNVALAGAYAQSSSLEYGDVRARGGTPEEAAYAARLTGAVEVLTEKAPMGFFVEKLGKTDALKFITGLLAREIPGEIAATMAQDAIDTAIANPDVTWEDYRNSRGEAIGQTIVATAMQSVIYGGLGAASSGPSRRREREAREAQTKQTTDLMTNLQAIAQASALRERSPEAFSAFVAATVEGGPAENVYIPGVSFAQATEAAGVPVPPDLAESLATAIEASGDLAIPMGRFLELTTGDNALDLMQEAKLTPDGKTMDETATAKEQQVEEFQAAMQASLEGRKADAEFIASKDEVQSVISTQLEEAGRFTKDVNNRYAALVSTFYAVRAAQLGESPKALFDRLPLRIQARGQLGGLDQRNTNIDTPEFKAWFGDSKIVDESGAPIVVYHGTWKPKNFKAFDTRPSPNALSAPSNVLGAFFTDSTEKANSYANTQPGASRVMPNYLALNNPYRAGRHELSGLKTAEEALAFRERLEAEGYDGIIFDMPGKGRPGGYVVFDPARIKSVFNEGTFDPNNPDTLKQDIFYSALENTIVNSDLARASAQQWKATIAKTAGVKKEELDWTGVMDWLDLAAAPNAEGKVEPVTREELLAFVQGKGVQVSEVLLGEGDAMYEDHRFQEILSELEDQAFENQYDAPDLVIVKGRKAPLYDEDGNIVEEPMGEERDPLTGDLFPNSPEQLSPDAGYYIFSGEEFDASVDAAAQQDQIVAGPFADKDAAEEAQTKLLDEHRQEARERWSDEGYNDYSYAEAERQYEGRYGRTDAKWSSYALEPANDYKELLLTLPEIKGPSTHWDQENVFAHVRFSEEGGTLAIHELQSDWHQKGRAQGYARQVSDEEKRSLKTTVDAARDEYVKSGSRLVPIAQKHLEREIKDLEANLPVIDAELERLAQDAEALATGYAGQEGTVEGINAKIDAIEQSAQLRNRAESQRYARDAIARDIERAKGKLADLSNPDYPQVNIVNDAYRVVEKALREDKEQDVTVGEFFTKVADLRLRYVEADQKYLDAVGNRGIPDAPFKRSWIALAMKRMIRYAVDNGFEEITWARGDQIGPVVGQDAGSLDWFYLRDMVNETNAIIKKYGAKVEPRGETFTERGGPMSPLPSEREAKIQENIDAIEYRIKELSARLEHTKNPEVYATDWNIPVALVPERAAGYQKELAKAKSDLGIEKARLELVPENLSPGFVITPELKAAAQEGFALFQKDSEGNPVRAARGTYNPNTKTITLLEQANLSTFLHETGHHFLDMTMTLAAENGAPQALVDDANLLLRWFGVPNLTTWNRMTLDEQRPHHEKFAKGFEAYLFTGRAPTPRLRKLFQTFRSWLLGVYNELKNIGSVPSPEVQGVMDRMLATSQEIADAEGRQGMTPLFTEKPEGVSDAEWENYQALGAQATQDATQELQTRSLRDLKWADKAKSQKLRELQRSAAEKRKAIKNEVTDEVMAEPVNLARQFLRRGEGAEPGALHRLSIPILKDMLGDRDFSGLGYGAYGMLAEEGLHPDAVAEMFGYPSGEEMVRDLLTAENAKAKIDGLTAQRMLERHGDLTDPQAMADAANEAIHNDVRTRFVVTELNMLNKAIGRPRTMGDAAREAAARIVARLKVKELRPAQYLAAERRAARAAEAALKKNDLATAADEKRKQLLNAAIARSIFEAKDEIDKANRLFARINTGNDEKLSRSRDVAVVNAARAILSAYGVGKTSQNPMEYLALVEEYDPVMYADIKPAIDAAVQGAAPIKDISYEKFAGVAATVKQLWQLSRRARQVEIDGKLMDRDTIIAALSADLDALGPEPEHRGVVGAVSPAEENRLGVRGLKAALKKTEAWAAQKGEAFKRFIWKPISVAADNYRADANKYLPRLLKLLEPIRADFTKGKIAAPELNYTFGGGKGGVGMAELIGALRHTGNESNLRKLLLGRGWGKIAADGSLDTSKWDAFLARMHKEGTIQQRHWDYVQAEWDLHDEIKPAAQKAHKALYGRFFAEVTAHPVETPFGQYRGGYVPARTDPMLVDDAALREDEAAMMGGNGGSFMFPSPAKGFTKGRDQNYAAALALDLRLVAGQLDAVLKFTHLAPAVRDVHRVLREKAFASKLDAYDPQVMRNLLNPWLMRSATQQMSTPTQGSGGKMADKIAGALRARTGMHIMFGNLVNTVQQFTGISIAAVNTGKGNMMGALWDFTRNPAGVMERATSMSKMMEDRARSQMFELRAQIDAIVLNPNPYEKAQSWSMRHAYFMQHGLQNALDAIVWTAAYEKGVERGETDPVHFADSVVRQTQSSFNAEDMTRFESGPALLSPFKMFANYFITQGNFLETEMGQAKTLARKAEVALLGFTIPAVLAEVISQAFRGNLGDEDEDGWWDDFFDLFFMSQVRYGLAMVPIAGAAINSAMSRFDDVMYNDRLSLSPVASTVETAVGVPYDIKQIATGKGDASKTIKDVLTVVSLLTGLPVGAAGRPLGYVADVLEGDVTPTNPADAVRGAVTGSPSQTSRN